MSLNKLGDFYLRRGQAGDADRALEAFQDCHDALKRLHEANPGDAQAARDLSVSLNKLGDFYLRRGQAGDADRALEAFQESLETAQRLHEANPGDAQAARDLSVSLNKLGDFYLRRGQAGDADRALEAFQESLETAQRLHEANPGDAQAARDLSVSLNKLGDFYLRRGQAGDADRALEAFQESLETRRRLHEANPGDAQAARDLSVSLNKLGDFYLRRGQAGDADRALEAFQDCHDALKRLHEANPGDAQAARDLSVSLNKLGDFYLRRDQAGDADRALEAFQESLETRRRLHEANPGDAQAARDLSVSLNKLGDFYLRRGQAGDADRALEAFQDCHDALKRLHEANPGDAQAARDLSVSLNKLGDFYLRRGQAGDADRALEAFQESLNFDRRLHEANPGDAQAARDLSVSLNKLGDFYLRRGQAGDADRALEAFQESLETAQRLHEANPGDAQAARDLSVSLERLGDFYLRRGQAGDADRALEAFQESLNFDRRLHEANPGDAQAARDLSVSLNKLGDFYLRRGQAGDADRALEAFQESLETAQRLHEANPGDAQAARDLSVSLERLGDFYLRRGQAGDADRALEAFQESLNFDRRLHEANPGDAQAARDLSVSHLKLGQFFGQQDDQASSLRHLAACFEILEGLVSEGREIDTQMRDLHGQLAEMFRRDGDENHGADAPASSRGAAEEPTRLEEIARLRIAIAAAPTAKSAPRDLVEQGTGAGPAPDNGDDGNNGAQEPEALIALAAAREERRPTMLRRGVLTIGRFAFSLFLAMAALAGLSGAVREILSGAF